MSALASVSRLGLVLVLLASMQSYLAIETAFALNRDVIAERYCVNRDRPELHCDGACVLADRLAAQNRRDDERQTSLLSVALSATMWLAPVARAEAPPARPATARPVPADERAARGVPGDVFHPPRAA